MAQARVLGGRYELREQLGQGGMARVYRATDRRLGRDVAVKVLAPELARDRRFVDRFKREARAAAPLAHPNVVSVFDTGSQDGTHYIVMELVEGRTLADVIRSRAPLPPEEVAGIGADVARALGAAHARGLVHRDVKPGNVMLTDHGHTEVMDFGIARAATDKTITRAGEILGTAAYISPEQAQGRPADERSDVYSLGCVLYEMATGTPPFRGDSAVAVAAQHVSEEPTPPSELNPEIPTDLENAILTAMAKRPGDRYPSADALGAALSGAASGGAATQPIPRDRTQVLTSPVVPAPSWWSRWWPAVALAAAGLVLLLVGLSLWAASPEPGSKAPITTSPKPKPPEAPQTLDEALRRLSAVINEGVAEGEVDQEAADKIFEGVGKAVDAYERGDLEKALEEIDHAREEVGKSLEEGTITSEDRASAIDEALLDVAAVMQANPIGDQGEEGGRGPGSGHGSGKAKGHDD